MEEPRALFQDSIHFIRCKWFTVVSLSGPASALAHPAEGFLLKLYLLTVSGSLNVKKWRCRSQNRCFLTL
jgi:hypothetical protein